MKNFHLSCMKFYLICWENEESRKVSEVSKPEAAYHLIEHIGNLDRLGVSPVRLGDRKDKSELVDCACDYMAQMTWVSRLDSYYKEAMDSLDSVEDALLRIDALETVLTVIHRIYGKCKADYIFDAIKEKLSERPDIVSTAGRVLKSLPPSLERNSWKDSVLALDEEYKKVGC